MLERERGRIREGRREREGQGGRRGECGSWMSEGGRKGKEEGMEKLSREGGGKKR